MSKVWLFSKPLDLIVLFLPVWITWSISFLLSESVLHADVPQWFWVVCILGIDVTHVWSTMYRTYFDNEEFRRHKLLLWIAPILVFVGAFLVNMYLPIYFWRIMAYLALFHFIKQQYGFMAIYRAKSGFFSKRAWLTDRQMIYLATIYPVIYWHFNSDATFNWFAQNDFFPLYKWASMDAFFDYANYFYFILLGAWLVVELIETKRNELPVAWGKILWLFSTVGTWYFGIVYFNSDLVFTLTNVVSHGVPYMLLIFYYVLKKKKIKKGQWMSSMNLLKWVLGMFLLVLVFAFIEESCWDMFVNAERTALFGAVLSYSFVQLQGTYTYAIAVALLSVPQLTHYMVDGFIWKSNSKNPDLKRIIFE